MNEKFQWYKIGWLDSSMNNQVSKGLNSVYNGNGSTDAFEKAALSHR